MKKIYIPLFVLQLLFMYESSTAQVEKRAGKIIQDGYPGGIIETVELEKSSVVEGSFFINNNWAVGNVLLYSGKVIKGMPLKYNLRDELLTLLDENEISRVIRDDKLAKFNWFDIEKKKNIHFVNCRDYKLNDAPIVGVLEVLTEGKTELLLYRDLVIQKGYYSVTHDAGQKNDEYKIYEIFYLATDKILFEVKNKKALLEYMNKESEEIKSYIKKQKLLIKDPEDLIRIVDYYNKIIE